MVLRAVIILFLYLINLSPAWGEPPFKLPPPREIERIRSAVIITEKGPFLVELYPKIAPWHVANFKYLADKGFYKGLIFHTYEPNYIIQGGDPTDSGNGGPGYSLFPEFSEEQHIAGTLGMSRKPDEINNQRLSNGSQFHIILGDAPHMDRKYTVFGRVKDGMNIVRKLRKGDRIKDIKVYLKR